ncbi:MAG: TolC family protein [Planctomycetota bacterium]|nr:TolC family protein [Planctomycetota bacterium]
MNKLDANGRYEHGEKKLLAAFHHSDVNGFLAKRLQQAASQLRVSQRSPLILFPLIFASCWSGEASRASADAQVFPILQNATVGVTGQRKTFGLDRPVDTLRTQLLKQDTQVTLTMIEALDVAAENNRDFQRQKEQLYLAALNLTREQHNFSVIFSGSGAGEIVDVVDNNNVHGDSVLLANDLRAQVTTIAGTRIVASFANAFLRSIIHGGQFDGSSIFNLTLTQPLLFGAGPSIVREPLTQSERDVIYAVRTFERFRSTFAVRVISDYYRLLGQIANLQNVEANYQTLRQSSEQIDELYRAGRKTITDLGRAKQSEYSADAQRVTTKNRLQTSLDAFKLQLGLPVTAKVDLDINELTRLNEQRVEAITVNESTALELARERRYDYRTTVDEVEDAGRRILVAENALEMALDFTSALNLPAETGKGLNLDWSRVNWSAGFELNLALDKLVERNSYRSSLISFDVAVRTREQSEDQIALEVRTALRDIQASFDGYKIQTEAVRLAQQRVEATTDLYAAGRVQALDKIDAQDALISAQLDLTAASVDYSVSRLQLMNQLECLALEPKGLRFDPALPIPQPKPVEQKS